MDCAQDIFLKSFILVRFYLGLKKKTILSKKTHFQSQQLKHLNKVWVKFKVYNKGICFDVVLVSFLLTSNIFYNLFWCSYCWLWTYIFLLGRQFVSYPLVHVTFFSLMKHEVVRAYILISQFSTKISAVDFRLLFKKLLQFFSGYFFKSPYDCWHIFMWLQKLAILDICKPTWLLRDNSNGCWRNSDRTYIYVVGCLNVCTTGGCKVRKGLR